MAKTYKVNEIFYSIQGEGFWTGSPVVFIRFAWCNLKCSFCDTDFADSKEMDKHEILNAVSIYHPCKRIVLTGGEPSLQADQSLLNLFRDQGFKIHIETNGVNKLENPELYDWITVSPKTADFMQRSGDEIKILFPFQNNALNAGGIADIQFKHHYIQPVSSDNEKNRNPYLYSAVEYVKQNPKWKLSCQMHKFLGVK